MLDRSLEYIEQRILGNLQICICPFCHEDSLMSKSGEKQ